MRWQCRHPSQIPREQWLEWLSATGSPSPYLLPEWGLLWEAVWWHACAEAWMLTDDSGSSIHAIVPLVRRRRFGLEMCYAQPYGTPCGPLTPQGDAIKDALADLLSVAMHRRTVEFACHPDLGVPTGRWRTRTLRNEAWLLRFDPDAVENHRRYSESHRRNIRRGEELSPRVCHLNNPIDATRFLSAWVDRSRRSRLILVRPHAATLIELFGPTGSLRFPVAWVDDRPVAAGVFLVHREHAVYVDGVFDRDPRFQGVGHFLFAGTLDALRAAGVRTVDLGGAPSGDSGAGLGQFKRGWGAERIVQTTALHRRPWYLAVRRLLRPAR